MAARGQVAMAVTPVVARPAQPIEQPAMVVRHHDPLQRSRDIATMPHDELRTYAKQIGIRARDIEDLTETRLRQNCMLTVTALVEAYTE